MSIRELIKGKRYKIELYIGKNEKNKIRYYEYVNCGKKEAELRENELKLQIKNNTFINNKKITIKELMSEYMEYNKDKWSPKTYYSNKHWVEDNIDILIGHVLLKDLNVKTLEVFYKTLKNTKNYSDKTIQHHYVLINGALNKAIKWDYINYNVNQKVEKPKARTKEVSCYTKEECLKLLDVIKNEPLKYQAIIMLALYLGVRRGELTGLTWEDIDFKNNSVNINKTTQYVKELGIYEKSTKSQHSDRKLFLPDNVMSLLKRYKKEQAEKQLKLGSKWGNSKRVLTTDYGYDMHPDTPSQIFEKIIKKYNLRRIKFHALRHTNASLMILSGVQHQTISRSLGHSNVSVTDSIYSHFFNEEFKEASDRIDNILTITKIERSSS